MRKYQILFALFVLSFILINFYLNLKSNGREREVHLADFNRTILDLKIFLDVPKTKLYPNNHNLWDMELSGILKSRELALKLKEKKKEKAKKPKVPKIIVKNREICLEKKCWELTGIMTINNTKNLILLTKGSKPKSEVFKVGDEVFPKLSIIKIGENSMVLFDKTKKRKINLKLFDINLSKYQPKVIKDKNE